MYTAYGLIVRQRLRSVCGAECGSIVRDHCVATIVSVGRRRHRDGRVGTGWERRAENDCRGDDDIAALIYDGVKYRRAHRAATTYGWIQITQAPPRSPM